MNFTDTLRGLWRRWYIVLPGLIAAATLAVGAWNVIPPGYERSATQLLIPGVDSMPDGANPYLFLGGLSPAADVLVRAIGSENVLNDVVAEHPGVEIEISRDITTAGPVILIVVTAASDAAAKQVLGLLVERTATVLDDLQKTENIAVNNRVTVMPITVDSQSILQQRNRSIATGSAGIVVVAFTLFVAGLVDGLSLQRRRRLSSAGSTTGVTDTPHEASERSGTMSPPSPASKPSPVFEQSSLDGEADAAASPLSRTR